MLEDTLNIWFGLVYFSLLKKQSKNNEKTKKKQQNTKYNGLTLLQRAPIELA